jgi:carboxymethylenebutenolidase
MGEYRTIEGKDGSFSAYVAPPAGGARSGAVVVLQEIFGVNAVMRGVTDALAAEGFVAICPDLFWRIKPGIDITDQTPEEWKQAFDLFGKFDADAGVEDIKATIAAIRADPRCNGKVGTVGYCLGGKLAFLSATRTDADGSVGYYGVGLENLLDEAGKIKKPLMLHVADVDSFQTPQARAAIDAGLAGNGLVTIHHYPGRDHAFAREGGEHFHAGDAALANGRTRAFFEANLA